MHALLSDKKDVTYDSFSLQLKAQKLGLNPSQISVDFKQAAINAFRANLPGTNIDGYFFTFL